MVIPAMLTKLIRCKVCFCGSQYYSFVHSCTSLPTDNERPDTANLSLPTTIRNDNNDDDKASTAPMLRRSRQQWSHDFHDSSWSAPYIPTPSIGLAQKISHFHHETESFPTVMTSVICDLCFVIEFPKEADTILLWPRFIVVIAAGFDSELPTTSLQSIY
jgi:hypothetical protein